MKHGPFETSSSLNDTLDRILDKGVVLDAWVRIAYSGIAMTEKHGKRLRRLKVVVIKAIANLSHEWEIENLIDELEPKKPKPEEPIN